MKSGFGEGASSKRGSSQSSEQFVCLPDPRYVTRFGEGVNAGFKVHPETTIVSIDGVGANHSIPRKNKVGGPSLDGRW